MLKGPIVTDLISNEPPDWAALTDGEISLTEHERLVAGDAVGAVVGFAGIVRNHDGGREVLRLEYSAHPLAEQTLFEVLAEVTRGRATFRVPRGGGRTTGRSAPAR